MENFILFFQIPDEICDKLVDYHKNNEYDKNNSKYGWDVKTKESVDCTCYQRSNHPVIQEYLSFMYQGLQAYQQKYDDFQFLKKLNIFDFSQIHLNL